MEPSFAVALAMTTAAGATFLFVGETLRQQRPPGAAGRAVMHLAAWAYATAAMASLWILQNVGAERGWLTLDAYRALSIALTIAGSAAAYGFLSYATFLGRRPRGWRLVLGAALLTGVFFVATLVWTSPARIAVGEWRASLVFEPALPAPARAVALLFDAAPSLAAIGLLLGVLGGSARSPTRRYRSSLLLASALAWLTSVATSTLALAREDAALQLADRLSLLAMATAVLLAYAPPHRVRERWRVRTLKEDAMRPTRA